MAVRSMRRFKLLLGLLAIVMAVLAMRFSIASQQVGVFAFGNGESTHGLARFSDGAPVDFTPVLMVEPKAAKARVGQQGSTVASALGVSRHTYDQSVSFVAPRLAPGTLTRGEFDEIASIAAKYDTDIHSMNYQPTALVTGCWL